MHFVQRHKIYQSHYDKHESLHNYKIYPDYEMQSNKSMLVSVHDNLADETILDDSSNDGMENNLTIYADMKHFSISVLTIFF